MVRRSLVRRGLPRRRRGSPFTQQAGRYLVNRRNFILGAAGATLTFTVPTGILGQEATPEPTQGFLFGNAHDLVPLGTGEGVEIVSLSPVMQVSMFALVRNNTDQAIGMKGVTGSARLDGELVGTVESA